MERLILSHRMENVRSIYLLVFTSSRPFGLDRVDPIFREKVVEMERANRRENFDLEFHASHLLQLSTNRFF